MTEELRSEMERSAKEYWQHLPKPYNSPYAGTHYKAGFTKAVELMENKLKDIEHEMKLQVIEKIKKMKKIITNEQPVCGDCVEAKADGYTICGDCSCE